MERLSGKQRSSAIRRHYTASRPRPLAAALVAFSRVPSRWTWWGYPTAVNPEIVLTCRALRRGTLVGNLMSTTPLDVNPRSLLGIARSTKDRFEEPFVVNVASSIKWKRYVQLAERFGVEVRMARLGKALRPLSNAVDTFDRWFKRRRR